MMNKDYILRMAERFGRMLAIILHLRQSNKHEEALISIDDIYLQTTGFTASFVNSASEEMLLQMIAPLGVLNVQKCMWIALLLKEEGDIYVEMGNEDESYYRYLKSLHFFLAAAKQDDEVKDIDINSAIEYDLAALEAYEVPQKTKLALFNYFGAIGNYGRAEDMLFEAIETEEAVEGPVEVGIIEQGRAFYKELESKSEADLEAGGMSRREVEEGLAELNRKGK
ncbi:MAG: DUF6483 family protein [Chloroflexota bacterium]|nr:DUF6483 family protein [Chloroflexota bacterium]